MQWARKTLADRRHCYPRELWEARQQSQEFREHLGQSPAEFAQWLFYPELTPNPPQEEVDKKPPKKEQEKEGQEEGH